MAWTGRVHARMRSANIYPDGAEHFSDSADGHGVVLVFDADADTVAAPPLGNAALP